MRKFGLIGYPLSHSFSPAFFAQKFEKEKIQDSVYNCYPIDNIGRFSQLLADNPDLQGINVTIPYKKSIISFLDNTTDAVAKTGACNCIKIENAVLIGHNTDVIGFEKSFSPLLSKQHSHALILGTGGSAAAVEFVLEKLGIDFLYVSRNDTGKKKIITYHQLNSKIVSDYKLIINTTPLGMYPDINSCPDIPYQFLTPNHYLFDLVYNPADTMFLKKGVEMGAMTKNGSDMLVIQAEESWKIWNE